MNKILSLYGRTVSLIVIIFVVSFTVLALAFLSLTAMEQRDRVRDLEHSILLANSKIRDFIITRDPSYAKETEFILGRASSIVAEGVRATNFQQLQNEVLLYLHVIGNLIDVHQERGFSEDGGLEGRIREKMSDVEARLIARNASSALAALATIRRQEKNYLLSGDQKYVDGVHDAVARLVDEFGKSGLAEFMNADSYASVSGYQYDFDLLVSLVQQGERIRKELDYFQTAIGATLQRVISIEQKRAQKFLWSALGLMLAAFVFGIVYSMYVAHTVLRPLEHLNTFFKRRIAVREEITEDNWESYSDNPGEIGELINSFRDVVSLIGVGGTAGEEHQAAKNLIQESDNELKSQTKELQAARKQIGLTRDEAARSAKKNAENLASMSHEFRTPLNGIIGMASLLSTHDLKADQREIVDVILTSGESMLGIVNSVLDYSRIDAGIITLEEEAFNVRSCVEDALGMLTRQAAEKGLDLSCRFDPRLPTEIIGDRARTKQILVNLLGNAVKFTPEGEVNVSLTCGEQTSKSLQLQFSIQDTGIGIKDHKLAWLFDPFTQAETSTSKKFGGTGLGLTISQRLAGLMGGSVWVESQFGAGSTFHFEIPFVIDENAPIPVVKELDENQRVLILNEAPLFGSSLCTALEQLGVSVDSVSNEAEAASQIASGEFRAVFINEGAGGFNGVPGEKVAGNLKKIAPGLSVVLLRHIDQNIEVESIDCLLKPIRQSALRAVLSFLGGEFDTPENVIDPGAPDDSRKGQLETRHARDRPAIERLRHSVLLVEDNLVNQKVGLRMLEKLNCKVDVVSSGAEAIDAVKREAYSFIFMDVQMPGMDGLEATRKIRALGSSIKRPVIIALTANATTTDRHDCIEAGMDDYTSKPVKSPTLELLLDRHADQDSRSGQESVPSDPIA